MPPSPSINDIFRNSRKSAARLIAAVLASMLLGACAAPTPPPTEDPAIQQTTDALQTQVAETANENATRDAEAEAVIGTSTQLAIEIATGTAQAALDNTATAQAESEQATATEAAESTGTQSARATGTVQSAAITTLLDALYVDRSEANIAALNAFLDVTTPEYDLGRNRIRHNPTDEYVEIWDPDLRFEDFVLRVEFITPYASATNAWDFAVFFRSTSPNSQFRLTISSNGWWTLNEWQGGVNRLAERNSGSIRVSSQADVPMTVLMVVRQDRGLFFANSQYIGLMDVSHKVDGGRLFLGIGSYQGHEYSGAYTEFQNFAVWQVPGP